MQQFLDYFNQRNDFRAQTDQVLSPGAVSQIYEGAVGMEQAIRPALHIGEHEFPIEQLENGTVDLGPNTTPFKIATNQVLRTAYSCFKHGCAPLLKI